MKNGSEKNTGAPHLDGAPGGVGEKLDRAVVAVIDVEAQQEIQLSHVYLLTHQQQLKGGEHSHQTARLS